MAMKTLNVQQGSPEWLSLRSNHFTASEAPAMLGLSKYKSRDQLLREKATGLSEEVGAAKQRLFDAGHAAEEAARPIVEQMIGEDLVPATGTQEIEELPLLASFDGINMAGDTCWENKLFRADLAQDIEAGEIDDLYWPQLEQQLLVSGAERVYFTASDGTDERTTGLWYVSVPARRQRLIAGWKQFAEDLANHTPIEVIPTAVASTISDLPALMVQIVGSVVASNLDEWKSVVAYRIESINEDLQDDQDFADADAMTKFLSDGEKDLDLVKKNAQAQAQPIDALFRAIDEIKESMRSKRLNLEKKVKARKESIRLEIVQEGKNALAEHMAGLNKKLGRPLMQPVDVDFQSAIKGKKTVSSVRDSVLNELANAKIKANTQADVIAGNLLKLDELATDYMTLFADLAHIVTKAPDDFTAVVKTRIAEHKEAEAKKAAALAEQESVAKPIPADPVAPILAAPTSIARVAPNIAPQAATGNVAELTEEIIKHLAGFEEDNLKLVLHYCEKLQSHTRPAA